jgi:hypothetical protein
MIPAPSIRCLSATVPGHMIRTAHGPNSIEKANTSHLNKQQDLKTKNLSNYSCSWPLAPLLSGIPLPFVFTRLPRLCDGVAVLQFVVEVLQELLRILQIIFIDPTVPFRTMVLPSP